MAPVPFPSFIINPFLLHTLANKKEPAARGDQEGFHPGLHLPYYRLSEPPWLP